MNTFSVGSCDRYMYQLQRGHLLTVTEWVLSYCLLILSGNGVTAVLRDFQSQCPIERAPDL